MNFKRYTRGEERRAVVQEKRIETKITITIFKAFKGVDIINGEYPLGVFFNGSQIFGEKNKGSQNLKKKI